MDELLYVLLNISLPVMILIGFGYAFQRVFKTDTQAVAKLTVYLIIPVAVFVLILEADITLALAARVLPYIVLLMVGMHIASALLGRALRWQENKCNALTNALIFFSTSVYGIPVIRLVFPGNRVALASQLFLVVFQCITYYTYGVYITGEGKMSKRRALLNVIRMPVLYAMALAGLLLALGATIPQPIRIPLNYIADAFTAVALISLGMQLADVRFLNKLRDVLLTSAVKVVLPPVLGFALVLLLRIEGLLAQALVIGITTPVPVCNAIFAKEMHSQCEYCAEVVLTTTVLCTLTLPLIVWFIQSYF